MRGAHSRPRVATRTMPRKIDGGGDLRRCDKFLRKDMWIKLENYYVRLIDWEVGVLKKLQVATLRWHWTNWCMSKLVSKSLGNDLSVVTLVMGPVTAYYMGQAQLWRFMIPCLVAYVLEILFDRRMKRPQDINKRFQPLCVKFGPAFPQTDVLVASTCFYSFGFECFYTFINHPIAGWEYFWLSVLAIGYIFTLSFSRVWAMVNFPHQIVFSNFLGLVIAIATYHAHDHIRKHYYLTLGNSVMPAVVFSVFGFIVLMVRIENNDVKYLSVEKAEYMRVLTNILQEDHAAGGGDSAGESATTARAVRRHYRRTLDARKKDGFVRMMETMEDRQERRYTNRLSEEEELRAHNFI